MEEVLESLFLMFVKTVRSQPHKEETLPDGKTSSNKKLQGENVCLAGAQDTLHESGYWHYKFNVWMELNFNV